MWVSNGMMYFHHMDLTPDSALADETGGRLVRFFDPMFDYFLR